MGRWEEMEEELSMEEEHSEEENHSMEETSSVEGKDQEEKTPSRKEKRQEEKGLSAEGEGQEEKTPSRKEKRLKEKKPSTKEKVSRQESFMEERDFSKENSSGKEMECKDFERLIPDFIAKKMDYPTLKRFCGHVLQCEGCREELDIQFLVQEGMQRLEEGNAFDLQSELGQRMEEAAKSIRYHSAFLYLGIAMEIVAVGLLAGIVIWILL